MPDLDLALLALLAAGAARRAQVAADGEGQGNEGSYWPQGSGDGRRVVFESDATNLVASDRNVERDVMDKVSSHQLPLAEFEKGLDLVACGKESVKVSLIP